MYNRYIPHGTGYARVTEEEQENGRQTTKRQTRDVERQKTGGMSNSSRAANQAGPKLGQFGSFFAGEDKNAGMAGILKALKLDELDSGDILLVLIMLLLFLEGDNIELVITLGLMLLLSIREEKEETANQKE